MKLVKSLLVASAISGLLMTAGLADDALIAKGEKIFNTKNLGNCLACHAITGKKVKDPGSFGPDLAMAADYPDELLYDLIYDVYTAKGLKFSAMPAFGKNGWLDDAEIKAVIAYIKSK
ncbi:MAG: sulfur-oxidizing protein SoxX [Arcobacteraceae bacterium]|jgi:sulfur-oxidizing protein SoxX